jgi:hypothetical protein
MSVEIWVMAQPFRFEKEEVMERYIAKRSMKNQDIEVGSLVNDVSEAWTKKEKWTDLILRVEKPEKQTTANEELPSHEEVANEELPSHEEVANQETDQAVEEEKIETLSETDGAKYIEFPCHTFILSARSAAFKEIILSTDERILDIPDINPATMKILLDFIYTDKVAKKHVDINLLKAADRFAMDDLKTLCSTVLTHKLRVSNSIEVYLASRQTKATQLEDRARNFIIDHLDEVMKTPEWKLSTEDSKSFAEVIMTAYFESKSRKSTKGAQIERKRSAAASSSNPFVTFTLAEDTSSNDEGNESIEDEVQDTTED